MELLRTGHIVPEPLSEAESAVLKALVYFDLFRYPLTLPEIVRFAPSFFHSIEIVEQSLRKMESSFIVFRFGDYYSLVNDVSLIDRRRKGNRRALDSWPKAQRVSNFIHQFPFVRSVNISGSLSKNYMDESTDFDFFIITEPDRIWLTRTLLALYKKIFLLNSRKYFCINYFISTDELEIPDKNLFSATEIQTLRNMTGPEIYSSFLQMNNWSTKYFPNADAVGKPAASVKDRRLKQWLEKLLAGKLGNMLDDLGYRITYAFWRRKFKYMNDAEFAVNLRSKKQVSKHHPQGFQFKVMQAFEKKCKDLEEKNRFQFYHG